MLAWPARIEGPSPYQGRASVVFTGDTDRCAEVDALARGCDLLLGEAGWAHRWENPPGIVQVRFDEAAGMGLLLEHLYLRNHRKIGFVNGPAELGSSARLAGFLNASRVHGLGQSENWVFSGTRRDSWKADKEALDHALKVAKRDGVTALIEATGSCPAVAGGWPSTAIERLVRYWKTGSVQATVTFSAPGKACSRSSRRE